MTTNTELLKKLCASFVARSEAHGYRGKKRDEAALNYLIGAAMGLEMAGLAEQSAVIGSALVYLVSVRGYEEVERLAKGEEG